MANNINTLVSSNNGVQSGATIVGRENSNNSTISNLNKASSLYSGNSRRKTTKATNESLNKTASVYSGNRRISKYDEELNTSNSSSVVLPEPNEDLYNEFINTVAPYVKMNDDEKKFYYQISSQISDNGGDASTWAQDFLSTNAIANVLGVSRSEVNQNRGQMLNYYLGIEDDKPLDFTTGATLINSIKQGMRQQHMAMYQQDLLSLYESGYDDDSPEVQEKARQIVLKEQEMNYFQDYNPRWWTTEWAKSSLSQLAYMGVGTLAGTLGGAVGGIIGNTFFGPVGGVKGFKIGSGLARFLTYDKQFAASAFWNMKQAGVSTETALKYSDIDGFINGLNEAFLDVGYGEVVGGVGKLVGIKDLGGKIVPTIVSRVVKDGTLAGWLGSLLLYIGLDAGGEFVQESTQSLTSSALQAIAEATDGLPYSNNVRDALASAWEEGIQGFATGLFFSGFGAGVNVLADVKKTSKVKNNAIHSYSKEAYVNNQENRNLVKSLKLGGSELSEDNITHLLTKLYDSTQSVREDIKNNIRKDLFDQLKTIDGSLNENTLDGVDITTSEIKDKDGNIISGKKTEVKRKSDGSTYFIVDKDENQSSDNGKEHYTMRIANPNVVGTSRLGEIYVDAKTAEYNNALLDAVKTSPNALAMEQAGAISFTLDEENKTLNIESVNVQDDNASLKEQAIRDLMQMYSDYSIEWNNRTQSDNAVFSTIESSNPRNTSTNTYGLNYTDNSKTTEEQSDRAYVRRWLGTSFSESASENDFMATILQTAAKARGLSGQEFIEKYFTEIKESEKQEANVKGYTKTNRDEITKQVKATIYAGKSADPTTFLHELNHAIILMGDNRQEFSSIFNKVKGTKQFMSFIKNNMDILRYVIGKTDDKGVYVLENGKYVIDEAKLQSLFKDANNWTRDDFEFEARLYEAYMRSGQTLNPTLTGFFRRVAETFRRVYRALRNGISSTQLNDEVVAYFDKLYGYDSSTGTTSVLNDSGELHDIGELRQETEESEVIKNVQEELNRIEPIDVMSADDVDDSFKRIKDKSSQAIKQRKTWAKEVTPKGIFSSPIGEVLISNNSIDDSLAFSHGANRFTASLYPQLDKLIENSVYATTSDRKGENRILLLSRFRRPSGEIGYVGIIVRKGRDSNIYYFHSVIKNKGGHGVATNSSGPGTAPSINNLIRKYLSVNDSTLFQTQDDISKLSETEQYDAIKKQYYGTDKYMIAPNGKASKLSEEQWVLVRTPNFIKWFGDWINDPDNASKVVDENGEPLVVYHGTRRFGFDTFNDRQNKMSDAPYGSYWFSSDKDVAHSYSGTDEIAKIVSPYTNDENDIGLNDNPGNYACFLSIKDPMTRDFNWNSFDGVGETEEDSLGINANDVVDEVKTEGKHDGVILSRIYDEGGLYDVFSPGTDYVVFDPNQIKSATENNGNFSTTSDSILEQTDDGDFNFGWNPYKDYTGGGYNREKGMSNRAVDAYENGEKPLSKWTKAEIDSAIKNDEDITKEVADALLSLPLKAKKTLLYQSSWHHTGLRYNRTDFYSLKYLGDFTVEDVERFKNEWNQYEKDKKEYPQKIEEARKNLKQNQKLVVQPFATFVYTYGNVFEGVEIPSVISEFAKNNLEYSIKGNAYLWGQKPSSAEVPNGLERLELQWQDKNGAIISLTKYNSETEKYETIESVAFPKAVGLGFGIRTLSDYLNGRYNNDSSLASEVVAELPMSPRLYHPTNNASQEETALFQVEQNTQSDLNDKLMRLASNGIVNDVFNTSASASEQYNTVRNKYYGTSEWLKAPNGKDTRLTEEQWIQVRTPNFINYFGDWIHDPDNASKVVDENGEPMPVYHTTNANFDTFKVGEKAGLSGKGIYFAIGGQGVPSYGSNTIEAFLNIRNPLTRELIETDKYSSINNNGNSAIQADVFEQYPEFDGVMVRKDEITVKDPSQIKSATDNNGEFSVDNDSILLQTAYHGSPNEIIGELSTKYMGTGEGQQIHGWGLYFAQDKNISEERYISRLAERKKGEPTLSFDGQELATDVLAEAFSSFKTEHLYEAEWLYHLYDILQNDIERDIIIIQERAELKESIARIENVLIKEIKERIKELTQYGNSPQLELHKNRLFSAEKAAEKRKQGLDLLNAIDKNPEKLSLSNSSRPSLIVNGQEVDKNNDIKFLYNLIRCYALINNLIEEPERLKGASTDLANKMYDKSYFNYFKSVFDKGELIPLTEKVIEGMKQPEDVKNRILETAKSITSVEVNAPVFGSLLTVDIPENEVLLDEQKRFSNQSDFVQKAVKRLFANEFGMDFNENRKGEGIYNAIQQQIAKKFQDPDGVDKKASLMLAKYGIEGITYVGGTDGRCFVIFTDEAIKKIDSKLYQIGDSEWMETAKRIAYEATSLEDFFKKYREQVEDGNTELDDSNVSQLLTSIYDETESEAYDPYIDSYIDEEEDSSSIIDDDWAVEEVERPTEEEGMVSSSTNTTMSDEIPDWFDLSDEEIASLNKDAETTETNTQELEKHMSEVQRVVVDADLPKGLSLDHSRSLDTSSHARAIEFANILKGSKAQTIEFLKTLREVNNEFFYNDGAEYNEAVDEESYQAKTIRESAFNNFKNMSKFIQNLVYESRGSQYRNLDNITDRAWKIVAGQVAANPDVYMDLYSRASGNTEWSGENSIEARVLSEIGLTERDWNDLSYSKRKEYIQYIEDKDIRKRILTGDLKDVDLKGYIERTEKRAEASLSEAKALEESQKYIINENKKTILKLGTEAQNYQKQLAEIEKEKAEIQEKLERNVKSMENKLKNSNMDTSNTLVHADLLKKMAELNRREAQYQKALRMWQKGSSTVTQEDLARIRGLIEDARAKIEELQKAEEITPEEAIKRLQNLYNAWKDAKTKETIDKLKDKYNVRLSNLRQTKNEAIAETRKRYMQIMKERETLRRIRSEKERLIKQIMKAPSANIAREEARQIKALQLLIDPAFRRGTIKALDGKVYTVAELKAMLTNNSNDPVIQTLTERQIERLTKTSLDEMTLAEVEDTYRYIKQLREEGLNKRRSEIIQRKAENQIIYNELTNALMESKNFADYGFEGTEDKKNRLNTKSGKVRNAWYQTLNMARKAQILDNNEKGTFYNLLIRKKRTLQNEEMRATAKRANLIQDTIKENNINPDTLYKTWTMNLEDGRTVTFTTSELAYIYLSQYCQENRDALAYGTFVSLDEKSTFQKSADSVIIGQGKSLIEARENKVNDDIRQLGDWRYNEALSLAKTVIEGDKGLYNLVKAIESDFNSSDFQRVIDLTRKIYNVDIKKEDYYLPLNRTDFLGKDPGEDIKNDLLNTIPGTRGVVDKGFTKERNKTISPLHQKAIKYDLFKVWTESVKKQEHFIAMQEYINQLNSLFVDGDKAKLLRSRIENTYGKTMLENLDEYIKEVANPDAGALQLDPTKDILNAAKGNIYAAYLGFKLSSITNQLITSPAAFLGKVSPIRLASNLLQMIVHYKSISEEVFELSPFMKSRNFDLIAGEIKESSEKLGLNKAQRGWNKFLEIGLKGLEFADQFSVVAGWKAIFDQELEKLGDSTEENIKTAAAIADEYVYETQPLSDKSEIAPLFKNKSGFTNIMLQFQTSLNVVWNNLAYDTVQDFKKKNWRKAAGTVFGYAMAGSLLALAHGEFKPDDDDDEDEKLKKFWLKFGYSTLSQGIESIPIFSNVVDPIFRYIVTDEKPSYTSNMITPFPFVANLSETTRYTVQAIREKDTEALTKAVDKGADAFMLALGLPYSGIRELEAIKDVGAQALLGERK